MIKKSILYILIALFLISGMVIAGAPQNTELAVLIPGPTGYFVATREGIDQAAEDFDVNISYANAQWNSAQQLSQVEDYIQRNVDMILLIAVDSEAAKTAVTKANQENIPIIAMVNTVGDDPTGYYDGLVTYVGQSDLETGKLAGNMAAELLPNGGNVIMIEGAPGTSAQRMRTRGFLNIIDNNDDIDVVYTQSSHWEREEAMNIMEDLMQRDISFDLVYCQDDNSAIGVGQVLRDYGKLDEIYVIGTDGSKQGLEALERGLIERTSWKSAIKEGYMGVEAAVNYLEGEEVPSVIHINQVEVNPENVNDFEGEW